MTAYPFEIAFARGEGVALRFHRLPLRIDGVDGAVTAMSFAQTMVIDGVPIAVPGDARND